jgi:acyl-homoserine lactone acylase PvdQ
MSAEKVAAHMQSNYFAPLNFLFVLPNTGEIGYSPTAKVPVRSGGSELGLYAKKGWLDEN